MIDLPAGSTPIDFAYHVHTEIGHHCRGARVNGKLVSLDYTLHTGDQVEVITTRSGGPSRDWLNPHLGLVKSATRDQQDPPLVQTPGSGAENLHRPGRRGTRAPPAGDGRDHPRDSLPSRPVTRRSAIFSPPWVRGTFRRRGSFPKFCKPEQTGLEMAPRPAGPASATTGEINVTGLRGMLTNLARCCKPVPGDPIVGYITRGHGATIHRTDCSNILRIPDKERLVRVSWGRVVRTYPVEVRITAYDREGLLRDVSSLVTEDHINLRAGERQYQIPPGHDRDADGSGRSGPVEPGAQPDRSSARTYWTPNGCDPNPLFTPIFRESLDRMNFLP